MRRLLIGPLVTGAGYAAGAYYGSNVEQIVHKSPDVVQQAIEKVVAERNSGTMQLESGKTLPYELKLDDHLPGDPLMVRLALGGRDSVDTSIQLIPQNNGEATLMVVKVHTDHSALREALTGTSKARLAYAPDWMLNLTARPVLQKLAEQIESGEALGDPMEGFQTQADWESSLPAEQQEKIQEWRQYDAARPTTDPNADAQRYLSSGGAADNGGAGN